MTPVFERSRSIKRVDRLLLITVKASTYPTADLLPDLLSELRVDCLRGELRPGISVEKRDSGRPGVHPRRSLYPSWQAGCILFVQKFAGTVIHVQAEPPATFALSPNERHISTFSANSEYDLCITIFFFGPRSRSPIVSDEAQLHYFRFERIK